MKYIEEYLEKFFRVKPLGEITTEPYEETYGAYVGEEVIIDGHNTGIMVAYIDYINWLEKDKFKQVIDIEKENENSDGSNPDIRTVSIFSPVLIPSLMFVTKSDLEIFNQSLKVFLEKGVNDWREAVRQYASKEAVDYAINVAKNFRYELKGEYSYNLLVSVGNSVNGDPYSPVMNYLLEVLGW